MRYDPQIDVWTEMTPIPIARIAPIVTVYNNKIYVFGGIGLKDNGRLDFSKQLNNIDVYDPKTNTWESKKPMPDYLIGAKCAIVIDNDIYFINIKSIDNKLDKNTYVYNPDTEIWRAFNINLPENWYDSEGVTFLNNKIYLIGGHDYSFKQCSDVYIGTIEKTDK